MNIDLAFEFGSFKTNFIISFLEKLEPLLITKIELTSKFNLLKINPISKKKTKLQLDEFLNKQFAIKEIENLENNFICVTIYTKSGDFFIRHNSYINVVAFPPNLNLFENLFCGQFCNRVGIYFGHQ